MFCLFKNKAAKIEKTLFFTQCCDQNYYLANFLSSLLCGVLNLRTELVFSYITVNNVSNQNDIKKES